METIFVTYSARIEKRILDKIKIIAKKDDRTQQAFITKMIKDCVKTHYPDF